MEAADAGEQMRIAQGPLGRLWRNMARLRHRTEQQDPSSDAPVLVGTHAAGAQDFDGIGDAISKAGDGLGTGMRRGIEEGRHEAVLRQAAEKLKALRRQGLVGKQLITRREYHADAAQQAAFVVR